MNRAPLSPLSALVAHLEPLLVERRVLVIGNAERSLAENLLDRGARLVQVLDPDPKRVSSAAANNTERRVTYAQLTDSTLREGSFDCALVDDVEIGGDAERLIASVRRAMNSRGLAVFCAYNPESSTGLLGANRGSIDYDSLCDMAEAHFEAVMTFGQSPFLGYSVVQFDLDHPPEPALDNAYLNERAETPDVFVALCGTEDALSEVSLEEMSIVQLPAARFVENSERIHRERELRARRHLDNLEKELRQLRSKGPDKEVERLTKELEQRDTWIRQLEMRAVRADTRVDDAEAEIDELETELEATHQALLHERTARAHDLKQHGEEARALRQELEAAKRQAQESAHHSAGRQALEEELNSLDRVKRDLESKLEEKARALTRLEKRFAEQEKEIDDLHDQLDETEAVLERTKTELADRPEPSTENDEAEHDLSRLENQLAERGQRILELEEEMKRLEIYAKTLSVELAALQQRETHAKAADPQQVEALAQALAEKEADLVAAKWTIGQLKQAALKD